MNRASLSRRTVPLQLVIIWPFRALLPLFLSLCLIACGSGGSPTPTPNPVVPPSQPQPNPPQPIVSDIQIVPNGATLPVGGSQQFAATALDASGKPVNGVKVAWRIDNPQNATIATVSDQGAVTAENVGSVDLIAAFGNVFRSVPIEVVQTPPPRQPIASIVLIAAPTPVYLNDTAQFVAEARAADGTTIPDVTFTWASSHPEVLLIDNTGLATAKQIGTTAVTATAEGIASTPMSVEVTAPPPAPKVTLAIPKDQTVLPTVKPSVTFDQPIDLTSLQAGGWTITIGNQTVAGQISCDSTCKTATFTPSAPLAVGTYTATVTSNVRSAQGISFNGPFPWSFSVSAGNGWQRKGVDGDLFGIYFASASEGWTVGIDQAIAYTADGGLNWTLQKNLVFNGSPSPDAAKIDFYDVYFVDAKTGWAVGWPEAIFKTNDGGATWVEQHLNRIPWTDRTGDGVWDRHDWCEVWDNASQTCVKKYGSYLRKVQFVDSQHGWTVGRFGYIFKTADGGAHWQEIPQNSTVRPLPAPCTYPDGPLAGQPRPAVTSYNPHLFTLDMISPNEVWIGGGSEGDEPCAIGWLRMLGHTTDGGQHWQFFYEAENGGQLAPHGRIFDMKFSRNADGSAGAVGFAVGGNGTSQANVLQTTDGGQTWDQVKTASFPYYSNGFYGIAFLAPSQIWLTGWGGLILHSEDGGSVWSTQQAKTTSQLRRVFFLDQNTGWIASQGQVFRTISGGR